MARGLLNIGSDGTFPSIPKITKVYRINNLDIGTTWTTITWETVAFDDVGAWSLSDPTKIIVPSGVTRIMIKAYVSFENYTNYGRYMTIQKNTDALPVQVAIIPSQNESGMHIDTGWLPCVQGDYYTVSVNSSTSGADILGNGTWGGGTWFEATFV